MGISLTDYHIPTGFLACFLPLSSVSRLGTLNLPSKFHCIVPFKKGACLCAVLNRSVVSDSATPWAAVCQAPLSMGFSRQEYWSGLPCPPPGDLPNPWLEPRSPASQADSLLSEPRGKLVFGAQELFIFFFFLLLDRNEMKDSFLLCKNKLYILIHTSFKSL